MARNPAQRMASLRARQRRVGLVTLTLVVPQPDAKSFASLAKARSTHWLRGRSTPVTGIVLPRRRGTIVERSAIDSGDIMKFRELLEVTAVGLVIGRLSTSMECRLRVILEWEATLDGDASSSDLQRLHAALGELSADPTLRFLLRMALHLTEEHSSFSARPRRERDASVARIKRLHRAIVAAILARNRGAAEAQMRRYLAGLRHWLY